MKKTLLSMILISCGFLFAQVRVGILNGPSCIPTAYLMEEVVSIEGQELSFEKFSDAASLLPKLLKNEVDVGFLPANVACKLYNTSKASIICTAITGEGNIVLITKDKNIKSFKDLCGKTVYVAGAGATPEYMFKYLLGKNGIEVSKDGSVSDENVVLDFSIPANQLAPMLISGKIEYAVVPEPFATLAALKDSSVNYAIDFQKEYKKITKSNNYPLTVMVANKKFAQENTQVMNSFLNEYSLAFEKTLLNPRAAASYCEKYDLGLNANVVLNALPNINFVYTPARDGKEKIQALLQIFLDNDSKSIGGKLPDDAFYY